MNMKKQGLKRAATVAAAMILTAALAAGGVCAMTHMTHTESEESEAKTFSEGSSVSVFHVPSLPDIAEESVTVPDDGILIRALDLSNADTLISDFSGLSPDIDLISRLAVPVLKCDGSPEVLIHHTHATESYADGDTYEDGRFYRDGVEVPTAEEAAVQAAALYAEALETLGVNTTEETEENNES